MLVEERDAHETVVYANRIEGGAVIGTEVTEASTARRLKPLRPASS